MQNKSSANEKRKLIDPFNREISYLRLSVTDRCDFRCQYCMAEKMTFLPRKDILSLEELYTVANVFTKLGVKKIRLTGGEPLIRSGIEKLIAQMGALPLEELALTTNGSSLEKFSPELRNAGVSSINISLDTLNPKRFKEISRTGELKNTLAGIEAACRAGFQRIRLNTVIMRGVNEDEILPLVNYAREMAVNITFIEEMPLGEIDSHSRYNSFVSTEEIKSVIQGEYKIEDQLQNSSLSGPSRDFILAGRSVGETISVGFISPHSNNFCHLCNRVRVTVEGRLLLCLGHENSVDLKTLMRENPGDDELLQQSIIAALRLKPEKHEFRLDDEPGIVRFMSQTGG